MTIETRVRPRDCSDRNADRRPPPLWAVRVAQLIPLLVLPSALWRLPMVFGSPMGMTEYGVLHQVTRAESVYVLVLSITCEAVALLSFGLVRRWGETVPAWLPGIGGRRIPPAAVVVPASAGGVALTVIWIFATVNLLLGTAEFASGWWLALVSACYLPLLLWGPLLLVLTVAYHRRRGVGDNERHAGT